MVCLPVDRRMPSHVVSNSVITRHGEMLQITAANLLEIKAFHLMNMRSIKTRTDENQSPGKCMPKKSLRVYRLAFDSRVFFKVSFVCIHVHALVCACLCVFSVLPPVHAPRGETGYMGCYLLLQRVTANHQP